MNKYLSILSFASLLLTVFQLQAQPGSADAILGAGDKAPSLTGIYKWIKGTPVTEFQKGHAYVVELGATWCGPCIASIPKMTALAEKYKGDISLISIFVQEANTEPLSTPSPKYVSHVEKFIEKQGDKIKYLVAVDNPQEQIHKDWALASGAQGIPQTFIVDRNGVIAWVGMGPPHIDSIVNSVLRKEYISPVHQSKSTERNAGSLKNPGDLLYSSSLSKYNSKNTEIESSVFIDNYLWAKTLKLEEMKGTIHVQGASLRRLFYMAFGDTLFHNPYCRGLYSGTYKDTIAEPQQKRSYGTWWYKAMLQLNDSSAFDVDYSKPEKRYDYELKVPLNKGTSRFMQKCMQQDLVRNFNYDVIVVRKLMPCWYLKASDATKIKLRTKTPGDVYRSFLDANGNRAIKNGEIRDFVCQLELHYGSATEGALIEQSDIQPPFVDATGITGQIDYTYDGKAIRNINSTNNRNTFELYRSLLKSIGIDLVKGTKVMNVVVIRDLKKPI